MDLAGNDNVVTLPFIAAAAAARAAASPAPARFGRMYGASEAMQAVYRLIDKVAPTEATVFVMGESGCGKELVATTVHERSARSRGPFVAVNCGAIPQNLIEAELFGHEKGAFTGAMRTHRGCFERAAGGTLFLDEITEMSPDMQVRLLRVLETGRFTRVGGDQELRADVRIVAATNRDPLQAVRDGKLREDLMYRLAVFPVTLPPLRERGDDVALIARQYLSELNAEAGTDKSMSPRSLAALGAYAWPGNVRELRNVMQRAFILAEDVVEVDLGPSGAVQSVRAASQSGDRLQFSVGTSLADMERTTIFATLDHCRGNKRRCAEILGVSLKTLYNRLAEYQASGRLASVAG
jgi:DNA-binding NtrC family response regulator